MCLLGTNGIKWARITVSKVSHHFHLRTRPVPNNSLSRTVIRTTLETRLRWPPFCTNNKKSTKCSSPSMNIKIRFFSLTRTQFEANLDDNFFFHFTCLKNWKMFKEIRCVKKEWIPGIQKKITVYSGFFFNDFTNRQKPKFFLMKGKN